MTTSTKTINVAMTEKELALTGVALLYVATEVASNPRFVLEHGPAGVLSTVETATDLSGRLLEHFQNS